MKHTVLVTGGAGFIGSQLAKRMVEEGHRVVIIDDLSTGFEHNIPLQTLFIRADISDRAKMANLNLPKPIDVVFHLAAQPSGEASFDDPMRDIEINYRGTLNVLDLAKRARAKRFIYTSSMSVYGDVDSSVSAVGEGHLCKPVSYYGCNKLASEKLTSIFVRHTDIRPTIFRLFNVYGPGQNMQNMKQGMVSIYFAYLLNGKRVQVKGSLDRFRDFIFVDDVVDALSRSVDSMSTYDQIFNVGTGIKTTVKDLLKALLQAYGFENFEQWVLLKGSTSGDIEGCVANIDKLREAIQWEPKYDVETGIVRMKQWVDNVIESLRSDIHE